MELHSDMLSNLADAFQRTFKIQSTPMYTDNWLTRNDLISYPLSMHQLQAAKLAFDLQSEMNDYERVDFLNSCNETNSNRYEYRVYSTTIVNPIGDTTIHTSEAILINGKLNEIATLDFEVYVFNIFCRLSDDELSNILKSNLR